MPASRSVDEFFREFQPPRGKQMGVIEKKTSDSVAAVSLLCVGRFHHFHLARQMQKLGLLREIWTGYPRFQLNAEQGIPTDKIKTFPWLQGPLMATGRLGIPVPHKLSRKWQRLAQTTLDRYASKHLSPVGTLIALSGGGLESGRAVQRKGGIYICDRGSSHIRFQDELLRDEYKRWKLPYPGVDAEVIKREEDEYAQADYVSVPSSFVADSFVKMGFPKRKLFVNPYGARLDRFKPVAMPPNDSFTVLFVGQVSMRKGFMYLLQAFNSLNQKIKRLKGIGSIADEIKPLLGNCNLTAVEFLGQVPNDQLPLHFSTAHVLVLPSIEEGLAMVIGEALACGCPVIASENTGARDFFLDGKEGFIVPIRSVQIIAERLEQIRENYTLRNELSAASLERVVAIGGWDAYGDRWRQALMSKSIDSDIK